VSRPIFSVVIPIFNASSTIEDAINSALAQTIREIEVLVVDDFSTDGSYEQALALSRNDNRLKVFRTTRNTGGPSIPRNLALRHSTGSFLAFLDHDDRWLPTKLERQLAKHKDGGYAVTYTRCKIEAPEDPKMDGADLHSWWRVPPLEGTHVEELTRCNFVPLLTATLDRNWMHRVGEFTEDGRIHEDWHYWLRVAAQGGEFGFVDESLAIYRWTPTNRSNTHGTPARIRTLHTLRNLGQISSQCRSTFAAEERRIRMRTMDLRLRHLPKPVRTLVGRFLLPPRLWFDQSTGRSPKPIA